MWINWINGQAISVPHASAAGNSGLHLSSSFLPAPSPARPPSESPACRRAGHARPRRRPPRAKPPPAASLGRRRRPPAWCCRPAGMPPWPAGQGRPSRGLRQQGGRQGGFTKAADSEGVLVMQWSGEVLGGQQQARLDLAATRWHQPGKELTPGLQDLHNAATKGDERQAGGAVGLGALGCRRQLSRALCIAGGRGSTAGGLGLQRCRATLQG